MEIFYINIIVAYLIGSIPFGLILLKIFTGLDIRTLGSGNIGATNAMRVGGKYLGFITFILDALKGVIAILIAKYLALKSDSVYETYLICCIAALFTVLGHLFPIWLKFRGGKGVATTIAVITYLTPLIGLIGILSWVIIFAFKRIASLASLTMMICMCFTSFIIADYYSILLIFILTLLIFIKHIPNIKRLKIGNESKI